MLGISSGPSTSLIYIKIDNFNSHLNRSNCVIIGYLWNSLRHFAYTNVNMYTVHVSFALRHKIVYLSK